MSDNNVQQTQKIATRKKRGRPPMKDDERVRKNMYCFPPYIDRLITERTEAEGITRSAYLSRLVEMDNKDNPITEEMRKETITLKYKEIVGELTAYRMTLGTILWHEGKKTEKYSNDIDDIRQKRAENGMSEREYGQIKQRVERYYKSLQPMSQSTRKYLVTVSDAFFAYVQGIKSTDFTQVSLDKLHQEVNDIKNWNNVIRSDDERFKDFIERLKGEKFDIAELPEEDRKRIEELKIFWL